MSADELQAVLDTYPELAAGLHDHADEVLRIAQRIHDYKPASPPDLPDDAPEWEHDYWRRRRQQTLSADSSRAS